MFVDGSPHYQDFVKVGDEEKRNKLKAMGYRLTTITAKNEDESLESLSKKILGAL